MLYQCDKCTTKFSGLEQCEDIDCDILCDPCFDKYGS